MTFHRICVFCGSSPGADPAYSDAASQLGQFLARWGIELVFGGGHVGLMGVLADAVLEGGGRAIGVIPEALMARELGHRSLTELRVVKSMHERKAMMAELSDGFIALPGGFGTFEEFLEVVTWVQLGLHAKPCGLLNVRGYYDPLLELIGRGVREHFIREQHRDMVVAESDPERLIERMATWKPPQVAKWIGREEA
jgi:uncharacterized protein (TIGR00730 family)